ncbi:VapE domain-containing protein [Alterisphingorhabdus coralli]|uniref:VapE family protein n=1 Tax=Alterisphingorhabdus coralli TaxID=3071408 RepID=A0AA97FB33_9SPHN|nr:VapE domain-containing protein [Parasphingorhabdus sp. SCSIO 66989]WOE76362.1 VapE family protein [Parasphingorhabdus sp. SCSIO 66989]
MSLLNILGPFIDSGFSIHWLHEQSKAPVERSWSSVPRKTRDELAALYRDGYNVGVRLGDPSKVAGGFLHVIDLDIRNEELADEAHEILGGLIPGYKALPVVLSGSGGESRHYYFITSEAFRSKKIARSEGFSMVMDPQKQRPVKKFDWEIELFGTGKQVAMPPSVHPDTGAEYTWERPFDFDELALGIAPSIAAAIVSGLPGVSGAIDGDADDRPPLGLSIAEAKGHVFALPVDEWCEDRDGWFQVGMALHHEFAGRGLEGDAFALWCDFSGQSEKFDINDARRVWLSFKDNKTRNIRMATIIQAAKLARFEQKFDAIIDGHDGFSDGAENEGNQSIDDLLGTKSDAFAALDDLGEKLPTQPGKAEWMSKFHLNDKGAIRPTLPNVGLIIANDIRIKGIVAYNEFSDMIVRIGKPAKLVKFREGPKGVKQLTGKIWDRKDLVNGDLWRDVHDSTVRDLIETPTTQGGYGFKVPKQDLNDAITNVAEANGFHPVREYLEKLEWDGEDRIETLFVRYFNAPDNAYSRGVARNMMIAAVTRIYEPGHKFDYAVILEGMQGRRKSTFIETLSKGWFGELASDFDNTNKMVESMQNAWLMEIPELSGFSRHDNQQIKAFISRRVDHTRLAYARRVQDFPRQCIFIGSTNDRKYLRDETGGRRFWPVECLLPEGDTIDTEALGREVDQLWAEAVRAYRKMREAKPHGILPLYLSDSNAAYLAAELQESRRIETAEDAMAGQLIAWLDTPFIPGDGFEKGEPKKRNVTCLKQLWIEALGNDPRSYNSQSAQLVGRAMNSVKGWSNRSTGRVPFEKYGRQRAYTREGYHASQLYLDNLP